MKQCLEHSLNISHFSGKWTSHTEINCRLRRVRAQILPSSLVFSTPQTSMEIESVWTASRYVRACGGVRCGIDVVRKTSLGSRAADPGGRICKRTESLLLSWGGTRYS